MAAFSACRRSTSRFRNLVVSDARLVRSRISSLRMRVTSSLATRDATAGSESSNPTVNTMVGLSERLAKESCWLTVAMVVFFFHHLDQLGHRHQVSLRREQLELVDDGHEIIPRHQALL